MKKRKGSLLDVLPSLFMTVAALILIMQYLYITQAVDIKEDVKQLSREYVLEMEVDGYLTPANSAALQQKLTALGVTGVSLAGTTTSNVGYGNPITLKIRCNVPVRPISITNSFLDTVFGKSTVPVTVTLQSTAKN